MSEYTDSGERLAPWQRVSDEHGHSWRPRPRFPTSVRDIVESLVADDERRPDIANEAQAIRYLVHLSLKKMLSELEEDDPLYDKLKLCVSQYRQERMREAYDAARLWVKSTTDYLDWLRVVSTGSQLRQALEYAVSLLPTLEPWPVLKLEAENLLLMRKSQLDD